MIDPLKSKLTEERANSLLFRFTWVKLMIVPPIKTDRGESKFFAVQWHQWEPIQNSELKGKYQEKSVLHS